MQLSANTALFGLYFYLHPKTFLIGCFGPFPISCHFSDKSDESMHSFNLPLDVMQAEFSHPKSTFHSFFLRALYLLPRLHSTLTAATFVMGGFQTFPSVEVKRALRCILMCGTFCIRLRESRLPALAKARLRHSSNLLRRRINIDNYTSYFANIATSP